MCQPWVDLVVERVMTLDGPCHVGVDGPDGAGKTTFADRLAERLAGLGRQVTRVRADDHLNPPQVRYRLGRHSPEGFLADSYDLASLADAVEAAPGGVVLVDGLFLHRPELRGLWDLSVYLDVPFEETYRRMARRDGCPADPRDPANARYYEGQLLYLERVRPRELADLVLTPAA